MRVVKPAVYILASKRNGTLYIRATGDLAARVSIHQQDLADGFTKRYGVHMLVHYEQFDTMPEAIAREKQLKKFRRAAKLALIESSNPQWRDITSDRTGEANARRRRQQEYRCMHSHRYGQRCDPLLSRAIEPHSRHGRAGGHPRDGLA